MTATWHTGDTRDITATLPDGSVDLILTSPPFLALRSYLPADHPDKHREIGSEATPAGTVGAVAVDAVAVGNSRDFIGIDIDPRNVDLARDRIGPMFFTEAQGAA